MNWLAPGIIKDKGKFELTKIIRAAFEDEASKCEGDGFSSLVKNEVIVV